LQKCIEAIESKPRNIKLLDLKIQPLERDLKAIEHDQRSANRRNALHSTGPETAIGRARSRVNSRKHGLSIPLKLFTHDPETQSLVNLIQREGYSEHAATELALALYEHRRVMDTYRVIYLDTSNRVKRLLALGRCQRLAAAQLSKAIRKN
jgi:hypothetical protein